MLSSVGQVLHVALPLVVSTGLFSLALFVDRTFLLWHDGQSMGAALSGGNAFWVLICIPMGTVSMTGAIVSQYVGAGRERDVGRFMWQSVWFSMAVAPWAILVSQFAGDIFVWTNQPAALVPIQAAYLRTLMIGAVGQVMETALSGFFSGTQRTRTIMVVSIIAAVINIVGDGVLIFGVDESWLPLTIPPLGIVGAGIASSISFWFKALAYGYLLCRPELSSRYGVRRGLAWDKHLIGKLLFFGFPTGLMYITESGAFAVIMIMIGTLGDLPLRATTMAINFNMIAFIPLVGVSIAASVLVGNALTQSDARTRQTAAPAKETDTLAKDTDRLASQADSDSPQASSVEIQVDAEAIQASPEAIRLAHASLGLGLLYGLIWAMIYAFARPALLATYRGGSQPDAVTEAALEVADGLLVFVAWYIVADAIQLVLAGILRGAGDT
ncbi:MAG: MATE family efflux transporter, partial [Planctomycetota bacterium]